VLSRGDDERTDTRKDGLVAEPWSATCSGNPCAESADVSEHGRSLAFAEFVAIKLGGPILAARDADMADQLSCGGAFRKHGGPRHPHDDVV
jgi:hypothetical protein